MQITSWPYIIQNSNRANNTEVIVSFRWIFSLFSIQHSIMDNAIHFRDSGQ